jgi:hypothetical protein
MLIPSYVKEEESIYRIKGERQTKYNTLPFLKLVWL